MYKDPLCPFCDIFEEKKIFRWVNAIPKDLIPYNRSILYQNEHFVIIPDISPIAKYHVLIIPIVHYNSLSEISEEYHASLLEAKQIIKLALADLDGKRIIFFEHGSCDVTESACISHAHLHCIPLCTDEISKLKNKVNVLNEDSDLPYENESYLFFEIDEAHYTWMDNLKVKQFLRKIIADVTGNLNRANWQGALASEKEREITKKWLIDLVAKFRK